MRKALSIKEALLEAAKRRAGGDMLEQLQEKFGSTSLNEQELEEVMDVDH